MKNVFSLFLCIALILAMPIFSSADVDLSGMSYEELVELKEQIDLAIENICPDNDVSSSDTAPASIPTVQPDENGVYPLEVKEYGYGIVNGKWLYYGFIAYNPNEDVAFYLPSFRITARDADGILLGTEDQVCNIIYPQQYLAHGFQAFEITENPSTFTVEALKPDAYQIKEVGTLEYPEYIPMEVINHVKRDDKILGEISNINNYDISMAVLTTIYRDTEGSICGGNSTFINNLSAESNTPFGIRVPGEFATYSYELYAGLW